MPLHWRPRDPRATLSGVILAASRHLIDPNFFRTVVLILEHGHDGQGALGVVLNRPTPMQIADVVPAWQALTAAPAVVFQGGPVERTAAIALARPAARLTQPETWFTPAIDAPGREVGVVNLSAEPADLAGRVRDLRIYSGYAGWGPGQIEQEIEQGGWLVLDHDAFDPLTADPAALWQQAASQAARGHGLRLADGPSVERN